MAHTVILSDIPPDQIDAVVNDYERDGATVTKTLQPNGNYTITAVYPTQVALANLDVKHGVVQHASVTATFHKKKAKKS